MPAVTSKKAVDEAMASAERERIMGVCEALIWGKGASRKAPDRSQGDKVHLSGELL